MQPVTPKRIWVRISLAAAGTVACAACENPEALLLACALWMSVVSDWYSAQPARRGRRTRRPAVRDSWAA